MAISSYTSDNEKKKFKESTSVAGQPAVVVVNPDGSSIGTGGGGGGTQYTEGDVDTTLTGTVAMWEDTSDTVRAVSAAKPFPVNVVAGGGSGGTSSTFGAAVPGTGTAAGFSDGTNMQLARAYDTDSGAGTQYTLGAVLRKSASGGSVELGTSSDPVRTDPTGTTTQPVSGTVTANAGTNLNTSLLALETGGNLAGAATSLAVIDDWDESDRAKVNPIAGQAGVAGGSGIVGATTQRVVLATDVALPAGTNAIGKLSANDGVDVGDVTINNAAGASAVNVQDGGNSLTVDYATTGSGTATGALRVELPTNGTGVIATVGAVTAITNALPAGTNAIGKLSANSGVDIGDVDVTSVIPGTGATNLGKAIDSAAGATDTGIAGLVVRDDALTTLTPADGDYTTQRVDSTGATWGRETQAPVAEDNTNGVIAVAEKPVVASTYSPTISTSFGTATKAVLKAAAGVPISAQVSNENAAVRYFQVHNKATNPAGTDVPIISIPVPAGTANSPGQVILDRTFFAGYYLATGVSWAISTTKATFTDSATASEHTLNMFGF